MYEKSKYLLPRDTYLKAKVTIVFEIRTKICQKTKKYFPILLLCCFCQDFVTIMFSKNYLKESLTYSLDSI